MFPQIGLLVVLAVGSVVGVNPELEALYKNCSQFEDELIFGGPVCGSDSLTYSNLVHMSCINHHRPRPQRATMLQRGACPESPGKKNCPWNPIYTPVCATDNRTYVNAAELKCRQAKEGGDGKLALKSLGECKRVDACLGGWPWGDNDRPVCASNGRTYPNAAAIHCLRKYHSDLDIVHEGGCEAGEVAKAIGSRVQLCALARNRYEWNPVCGVDGKTYINPAVFLCMTPHIAVKSHGECGSRLSQACVKAGLLDRLEGTKEAPVPVCATDGLTYKSEWHLVCASRFNKYLVKLKEGKCGPADSPCLRRAPTKREGTPVCGTDRVTYASPASLYCVQRSKDPNLRYLHDGICMPARFESKIWGK